MLLKMFDYEEKNSEVLDQVEDYNRWADYLNARGYDLPLLRRHEIPAVALAFVFTAGVIAVLLGLLAYGQGAPMAVYSGLIGGGIGFGIGYCWMFLCSYRRASRACAARNERLLPISIEASLRMIADYTRDVNEARLWLREIERAYAEQIARFREGLEAIQSEMYDMEFATVVHVEDDDVPFVNVRLHPRRVNRCFMREFNVLTEYEDFEEWIESVAQMVA